MATLQQITNSHARAVREAEVTLERITRTYGARSPHAEGAARAAEAKKVRLAEWKKYVAETKQTFQGGK